MGELIFGLLRYVVVIVIFQSLDIVIHNSELLSGALDKSVVGSGSKNSVFYVLLRDFSEQVRERIFITLIVVGIWSCKSKFPYIL